MVELQPKLIMKKKGKMDIYACFTLILYIYEMFATYCTFIVYGGKFIIITDFINELVTRSLSLSFHLRVALRPL